MPKADGTPCKHNCKSKSTCVHDCCKDAEDPPPDEDNEGDGDKLPVDFTGDPEDSGEGSEGEGGTVAERNRRKRADDANPPEEMDAGMEAFARVLGNTLGPLVAGANNPELQVAAEITRHKIRTHANNPFNKGDIYDVHKVTANLRSTENVATGDNFFACAKMLEANFPDATIRTICSIATRGIEHNGQKTNVMMNEEWYSLCKEILIKLIESASDVTNAASRWLDDCEPRAHREQLEAYHARFKNTLEEVMWVRESFGKVIDGEWMTKKKEKFINNLNSQWARVMVLNMPETHTLQQIFSQLQRLARAQSLDKDAMGAPSKQTKFALNTIHQDRKGKLGGSSEDFASEESEQISRQNDQLANYKKQLSDKTFELHELKESVREPVKKSNAPLHCIHCPPHRAGTHNTVDCFRGPDQDVAGSNPGPQRGGGGGRGAPPDRARGRDCYNCGEPGHYAAGCKKEKKRRFEGPPRGQTSRDCSFCSKAGHTFNECFTRRKAMDREREHGDRRGSDRGDKSRDNRRDDRDRGRDRSREESKELLNSIKLFNKNCERGREESKSKNNDDA